MLHINPHKYDALDMRRDARLLDLRNRVEVEDGWLADVTTREYTPIESAAVVPSTDALRPGRYVLGDFPHRVEDGPWGSLGWASH